MFRLLDHEIPQIWGFLLIFRSNRPPEPERVPSSYCDYEGNESFFCGIFRDINAVIAARKALGWDSVVSDFGFEVRSESRGGVVTEARTGKRFPLHLPIKIHKEDTAIDTSGVTGNLSAAGVYIRSDASLEVGSPVEFEITLPPEVTGGKEDVVIQCRGRVVRTDEPNASAESGDNRGVACVIDSYEFVRNS